MALTQKTATVKDKEKIPGGPAYITNGAPLSDYQNWQQDGVDDAHKCAIQAIANNEGSTGVGDLAAVQSYDSQVLSSGAMQKTINIEGNGELAQQLADFKETNPAKYKSLFEDKGWTVETEKQDPKTGKMIKTKPTAYFQDPNDPNAPKLTGKALMDNIRQCDGANFEKTMKPWRDAGKDPDFQKQQIKDFNKRISQTITQPVYLNKKNTGFTIGDYVSSSDGVAHLTDVGVNSGPGNPEKGTGLAGLFSTALNQYSAEANPPDDPSQWTDEQRNAFMSAFRKVTNSDQYDPTGQPLNDRSRRWKQMEDKSKCLSTQSGAIQ